MNENLKCESCGSENNMPINPGKKDYILCTRCSPFHKDLIDKVRYLKKSNEKYKERLKKRDESTSTEEQVQPSSFSEPQFFNRIRKKK